MPQMIYSVAAIFLLGISFLNVNRKVHGTQERMMFSELALEMTSVGAELLDEIGKYPFDNGTISGLTTTTDSLSTTFGGGTCNPDDPDFGGCSTISDFHGKTATRSETRVHGGTTYTVPYNVTAISVAYVGEASPHAPSPSNARTFAKEVTLTVSTPALLDGNGDPIEIEMSRVYMYPDL